MSAMWNKLIEGESVPPHDIVEQIVETEQYWLEQAEQSISEGAFTIMDEQQQEEREPELAKRRKLGHSFFYYHQQCGTWRELERYELVAVTECAPETYCCGCWGNLHDAPVVSE